VEPHPSLPQREGENVCLPQREREKTSPPFGEDLGGVLGTPSQPSPKGKRKGKSSLWRGFRWGLIARILRNTMIKSKLN